MSNTPLPPIRKLKFSMFSQIFSDNITALKYDFIVFSKKKITIFWCIFIVYTSINGLIQCTLVVLVFAGIIFRTFHGFCPKSLKFVPAKYSTLLKPRKLIPAKKTEKNPEFLGIFHPCDKAVRNKKCKLILKQYAFFFIIL